MSTLITTKSISIHSDTETLFNDLSLTISKGDRIGLIGHNGSGKSTLLKILNCTLSPYQGSVSVARDCIIGTVEQHLPEALGDHSAIDAIINCISSDEKQSFFWKAETLLNQMNFSDEEKKLKCSYLSGGQHSRILLARALIKSPDLLLLDEPSNHLDMPSIIWLEDFLSNWSGSFVMVSHDAKLLDKVTNKTWILRDKKISNFSIPCSQARNALAQKDESDLLRAQAEKKEIERVALSAKRLAIWGKDFDSKSLSRKAKSMEKHVEILEENKTEVTEGSHWYLSITGNAIKADRLIELSDFSVNPFCNKDPLFHVSNLQVKSGQHIAIVGRNGSGKSSLLKVIWDRIVSNEYSSEGINFNPRIEVGYYDQELRQLLDHDTIIDSLEKFEPDPVIRKNSLIKAGYKWDKHEKKISTLSGGERSRLLFLGLSLAKYNFIMLDEPTNHLDIDGKVALAESLRKFPGAFLLVSHDREFINACCNKLLFINKNNLNEISSLNEIERLYINDIYRHNNSNIISDIGILPESDILEKIVSLEKLINDDLSRKIKHQKPDAQKKWQIELDDLYTKLDNL